MAPRSQNDLPGQEARALPRETACQPGTKITQIADRNVLPHLPIYCSSSVLIVKIFQLAKRIWAEVCSMKDESFESHAVFQAFKNYRKQEVGHFTMVAPDQGLLH